MKRGPLRSAIVLALAAGVAFAGYKGLFAWLESRRYFEERLATELSHRFRGEVAVGSARLRPLERSLEAKDIQLRAPGTPGAPAAQIPQIVLPEASARLPLSIFRGEEVLPERIALRRPLVKLVEREDGTFSPLDLVQMALVTTDLPTVTVEDGTVELSGVGQVSRVLDKILRKDLARRIEKVKLATVPMPETSDYLLGFSGSLQLQDVATMTLFGGLGRDNSLRLDLELGALDLASKSLRDALAPEMRRLIDEHVLAGTVELRLEVDVPATPGAPARLNARLKLDHLALRHSFVGRDLTDIDVEASFDGDTLWVHDVRLKDGPDLVRIEGVFENLFSGRTGEGFGFDDWRFTLRGASLRFEDSLLSSLAQADLREAIDDYSPAGRAEVFCEVSRRGGGPVRASWHVKPQHASCSYVGHVRKSDGQVFGFPYRITDVTGEIVGDGGHIEIRNVAGQHKGIGGATVEGVVDIGDDGISLDLQIAAKGAILDDGLVRDALEHVAPGAGAIVDRFAPKGTIDAAVRVSAGATEHKSHVKGRVDARDLTATLRDFPLPLRAKVGNVEFDDNVYTVNGIVGITPSGAEVKIDGSLDFRTAMAMDLRITAKGVRAEDADLRAAVDHLLLAQGAADRFHWDWLKPLGELDAEIELKQEPGGELRFRTVLFPRGVELIPHWFAVPLQGVVGRVEFGNLRKNRPDDSRFYLILDRLNGRSGSALVSCDGVVEEGGRFDLGIQGQRVAMGDAALDELVRVVREAQAPEESPGADALAALRPHGLASFDYRYLRSGEEAGPGSRLDVVLHDVAVALPQLPGGVVDGIHGGLHFDFDKERAWADPPLAGQFGSGRLDVGELDIERADGALKIGGKAALHGLPFDDKLLPLLPPSWRESYSRRESHGSLDLDFSSLQVQLPVPSRAKQDASDAAPPAAPITDVHYTCRAELTGAGLRYPVDVDQLAGSVLLSGHALVGPNLADHSAEGRVESLTGRVKGLTLRDVTGGLYLGPDRFEVKDVNGGLAGGALDPTQTYLRVGFDADRKFEGGIAVSGADLKKVLQELGSPAEKTAGRLTLGLTFDGRADRIGETRGRGRLSIDDGELGEIPLFASLYRLSLGLVLGGSGTPSFSSGSTDFRLENGRLLLDRFALDANVAKTPLQIAFVGGGELGPTGVDLVVKPSVIGSDVLLISFLIDQIKNGLARFRIYGPISNPRTEYWTLPMDVIGSKDEVTNLPRLVAPKAVDWSARF